MVPRILLAMTFVLCIPIRAALNLNIEVVKKSVVFLYGADASGNVNVKNELGTGFLVSIPLVSDPERGYLLLVTARHIVDPQWAKCTALNPKLLYARLNRKGYVAGSSTDGVLYVPLPLIDGGKSTWKHSSEEMADAAVLLVRSPTIAQNGAEVDAIKLADFPTEEELNGIVIGDQIVSAGLIPGFSGKKRNYPFFKFGFVSSIPDEEIEIYCLPPPVGVAYAVRGWFIAATLVPGNSGSPIFFVPPGGPGITFGSRVQRAVVLGVQSSTLMPADIAVMTPIRYVIETIRGMQLQDADLHQGPRR